jgi:hypothetical protein
VALLVNKLQKNLVALWEATDVEPGWDLPLR